ncbi:MAG: large subunit ribosomal protein L23 [Parcubacteria group bacterium Athens1014_10]|nr:MAG: large subunit ribosomal protein L23 [Parcubacteria group bacterium Athens1014_10]TSD05497.1 MAG: large subunit ribosomal protein L23 [Parcubacteria group bacterium Athens0714_12]
MALFGFKQKKETEKKEVKKEIKKEPSNVKIARDKNKIFKKDQGLISKILIKPLITEKTTDLAAKNKYVFEVSKDANKIEIKKAIEGLYNVSPIKMNIIKTRGKNTRYGKVQGKTKNLKKAIITLKKEDKIEIFKN